MNLHLVLFVRVQLVSDLALEQRREVAECSASVGLAVVLAFAEGGQNLDCFGKHEHL